MKTELILGDCLEVMPTLGAGSVDLVLADPPYGTTACSWDSVLPLDKMWECVWHSIKNGGAVVMTTAQPFTSSVIMSCIKKFKYEIIWDKVRKTGHLNAKKMPMRRHENIIVFCKGRTVYIPQMVLLDSPRIIGPWSEGTPSSVYGKFSNKNRRRTVLVEYPDSILRKSKGMGKEHPTQKPVALMEYLIRTYTREGETVLDFTMGSGTTGVACVNTGRNFIGIEKEPKYFKIAQKRIQDAKDRLGMFQ